MPPPRLFRRRIAVPQEHGSWALFLSPLVIGLFAGGRWHVACAYLLVAAFAAFMLRQPLMALAKVRSGRRPASDRAAAWFWLAVYGGICALHVYGLWLRGFGYVLHLAVPGALVAAWHLTLVMRKAERRQWLLEIIAVGGLALSAPAGMWVGREDYDPLGWLLWALLWMGAAGAIVHTYLLLEQRVRPAPAGVGARLRDGRLSLGLALAEVVLVAVLGATRVVPLLLVAPFALHLAEVLRGTLRPAQGVRPKVIGIHQLGVQIAFAILFILAWCGPGWP